MARPGLDKHVKFRKLVRILNEPEPHVRGYLETLWEVAYEHGDPVIGDAEAIEAAAKYPGAPGKLFSALLTCGGTNRAGFIEATDHPDEYQIHDLLDHAPDYVKKRQKRENERKSNNIGENGGQRRTLTANGAPPAPAPCTRSRTRTQIPAKPEAGAPVEPVSTTGAFADLSDQDLESPAAVMGWLDRQQSKPKPVVRASEANRINVMAAAVKATTTPDVRSRVGFFGGIVSKALWKNLNNEHIDEANRLLREFDAKAQPPPDETGSLVKALAESLALKSVGKR